MAPILSASVGITRQIVDDERLRTLRSSLEDIKIKGPLDLSFESSEEVTVPLDIEQLVSVVEPWTSWPFEEQVDLHEWVDPLNKIDASLSYYLQRYPSLLLIEPVERNDSKGSKKSPRPPVPKPARTLEDVMSVPDTVHKNLAIILSFLSGLLKNSWNKSIFNTAEELGDLLAAADDGTATAALEALCSLATPPSLHKQQIPDVPQHATALHLSKSNLHKRLVALAKGWGSRGSGLGLYTCAVADDSESGQGALLQQAGELHFTFFRTPTEEEKSCDEEVDESFLVTIKLQAKDIVDDTGMVTETTKYNDESDDSSKQKRRRVAPSVTGGKRVRSTAELFFRCVEESGGHDKIPDDRLFPLLADVRLTKSFYCQESRVLAIERRLRALITCLHAHPSQDIMTGYFQAQPELCVELVDLLRPTVSSAVVSSGTSSSRLVGDPSPRHDSIVALANSPIVPYDIRELSIRTLTALVARRDGTNGALAGAARHSNVLNELGVGKGQYLGLLPTLIRFSLASLGALVSSDVESDDAENACSPIDKASEEEPLGLDLGMAFLEATAPPSLTKFLLLRRALLFVESVLDLTAAVVSTPTGTSSLTECGLVPALLNTVSVDSVAFVSNLIIQKELHESEGSQIVPLLRFIAAQAVQILEGAVVTHGNALSAFHNLEGVEILTSRLSNEIMIVREGRKLVADHDSTKPMDVDSSHTDAMDVEKDSMMSEDSKLTASQRVLLFGVVTCLTVVFHQESTSSSVTTPSGSSELRKPELTEAVKEILDNVEVYGGHLASLIATLLSDVMNSDPHIVHYVHDSGLASSFLSMLEDGPSGEPITPPVPELIMTIPNVLAALALTEAGSKVVKEANPFPGVLKLLHHPKYAMPRSRCLLNDMTSIVGTGLDEIMRHVPSLKRSVCVAITEAMTQVVAFGSTITSREENLPLSVDRSVVTDVDTDRTCLMQYALNFGQILEQILHTDDHCDPFVQAGGLDAILQLYPLLMPAGEGFLAHISCLSCPAVSTICHSTTEDMLSLIFKCIALKYDPLKCLQKVTFYTKQHIDRLESLQLEMRTAFSSEFDSTNPLDAVMVLEALPRQPIYDIADPTLAPKKLILSKYLREVISLQWLVTILSATIRASCQRGQESGSEWSRSEREWKKELSSSEFKQLFSRLSTFFQSATVEVCRIRTEEGFEERNLNKQRSACNRVRYKLRIVCPEGAIVRNGTEIDDCASVGSMEMGEIVEAYDRCINSSGVLRYHTTRGWVSEHTRGHGREPISEVLAVWAGECDQSATTMDPHQKRIESEVPDLIASAASVLARLQTCHSDIFTALTRLEMQNIRSLSMRSVSFQEETLGYHVSTMLEMMQAEICRGLGRTEVLALVRPSRDTSTEKVSKSGIALYLGSILNLLQSFLFEEKRDRCVVNLPLLIPLVDAHLNATSEQKPGLPDSGVFGVFEAIAFIFEQGLADFDFRSLASRNEADQKVPVQRLSRSTASSLPTAMSFLRRMLSLSSFTSSPSASVLVKMKPCEVTVLVGHRDESDSTTAGTESSEKFSVDQFARIVFGIVSDTVLSTWSDSRFVRAPSHIVHPMATLASEAIAALQESTKETAHSSSRDAGSVWNLFRSMLQSMNRGPQGAAQEGDFEPSEEAIARLMEMGFSRDHSWEALDSVGSNRVEIAAEYALAHPSSSPAIIERRRTERANRRRQREQQQQEVADEDGGGDATNRPDDNDGATSESINVNPSRQVSKEEAPKDTMMQGISSRLDSWKAEGPRVACGILSSIRLDPSADANGDAENEALTMILSSFLLDLYQRFPEEKKGIVESVLTQFNSHLVKEGEGSVPPWSVIPGHDAALAALYHCTVIMIRTLPEERKMVLKGGLVGKTVTLLSMSLKCPRSPSGSLPSWLPPSLLLLEVMAQPLVAFPTNECSEDDTGGQDFEESNELNEVKEEHAKSVSNFSFLAHTLFLALNNRSTMKSNEPKQMAKEKEDAGSGEPMHSTNVPDDGESTKDSEQDKNFFSSVPPFFPLLPSRYFETCADICLSLLDETSHLPAGVAHATLLLLLRLLRDTKISTYCLNAAAGERIIGLRRISRFTGHVGLASLIFRRLLEDEPSLQSAMENEIRSIILKLDGKKENFGPSDKQNVGSVRRKTFVEAVTHLLCRDPTSFVKAMAVSVMFQKDASSDEWMVCLLPPSERSKNMKIVSETLKSKKFKGITASRRSISSKHRRSSASNAVSRSKTPTRSHKRSHTPKRSKKDKAEAKDKPEEEHPKHQTQHHTPISQVVWLLANHAIRGQVPDGDADSGAGSGVATADFGFDSMFLWTANALDVLADLVIAVPACAASVHKFKPSKKNRVIFNDFRNALQGCPSPPKSFVSFLLHGILSQDRWYVSHNPPKRKEGSSDETEESREKKWKKVAGIRTKVVQSAARLLVALVARPGESRKRVICELVFALSGGQLGLSSSLHYSPLKTPLHLRAIELHALKAWGELTIGFAAPRSNGSNVDESTSLSFEVVKIMLENGMVHALLVAMHRVPLHHPLAPTTVGALILPFEILTRPTVADVVKDIAEKGAGAKEAKVAPRLAKQSEAPDNGQSDDHMLEDAFAADSSRIQRGSIDESFYEADEGQMEHDDDVIEDGDHQMIDVDGEEVAAMEESDEEASSESEDSSSGTEDSADGSEDDSDGDDESADDSESDEDDSEDEDSILEDADDSVEYEENGIDFDYEEDGPAEENEFDGDEDDGEGQQDGVIEDGWTRIEPGGSGGILGRRSVAANPTVAGRGRDFIDAAEAMIGQLLRSGEIPVEALAEIEGTLGIRIVQPSGRQSDSFGGNRGVNLLFDGSSGDAALATNGANRRGPTGAMGSSSFVSQRSQPSMGGGGRWHEFNTMEYVFGGPCVVAGNRNYDLATPIAQSEDGEDMNLGLGPAPSDGYAVLFPGGPAAATHIRTQNALHPLLGGVDLPPLNSLVSDLQPHGTRARNAQVLNRREPQRGLFISSTGGGAIVSQGSRSNRPPTISGNGWAGDEFPLDLTVEQFGTAFENALGDSMAAAAAAASQQTAEADSGDASSAVAEGDSDDLGESLPVANEGEGHTNEDDDVNMSETAGEAVGDDGAGESTEGINEPTHEESNSNETAQEETGRSSPIDVNDGDGVASSLAEGLRLSPGHGGTSESEEPHQAEQMDERSDQEVQDAAGQVGGGDTNPPDDNLTNANETGERESGETQQIGDAPDSNALVCPPGMDEEVFNVLPVEMQLEVVREAREASELSEQIGAGSSFDPEALAALPEDVRREVIAQEQQDRRMREQTPADPSNAEEMDNASFLASLAPDLRHEILLTADDAFIASLPPIIAAEAQLLRERARANHRMLAEQRSTAHVDVANGAGGGEEGTNHGQENRARDHSEGHSARKKRAGKFRVELDRKEITYIPPPHQSSLGSPLAKSDLKALLRFLYLLSPVRPHKLLQKVFHNLSMNRHLRSILSTVFLRFLQDDNRGGLDALDTLEKTYNGPDDWRTRMDAMFENSLQDFPPALLIGTAPEVLETDGLNPSIQMIRRRQTSDTAASIAANLPITSLGSYHEQYLPPVVATRIVDTLQHLCKHSARFCLDMLLQRSIGKGSEGPTGFETLLDLLEKPRYSKSSANLEQLLSLLELIVTPLSHLPRQGEEPAEISQREIDGVSSQGKEWIDVPRVVISQQRLQSLCAILRMETCKDTSFAKINTIARRLCRVDANRAYVLAELASVARALGADAIRDLKALNIRMSAAVLQGTEKSSKTPGETSENKRGPVTGRSASSSVAVSTSTSELKLLRVLQTLQSLCADYPEESATKRSDGPFVVNDEMVRLLEAMALDELWTELSSCLKVVQMLEGVNIEVDAEKNAGENDGDIDDQNENVEGKKLQNSVAGLLTRFLPAIEAFFVANASATTDIDKEEVDHEQSADEDARLSCLVGGKKLIEFVEANKVLINALIRNNPGLLDKGLRSLIQVPRCRVFLDFDVKRHWFKLQVRRLRQHANRRHGSLRLNIRREHVFEDTYHQLRLRNSEEMRGRLNITFRNEQGVDAGGLSREFFGVLAKEIFNPNYALFTSTEDGSTFQPNPNSSINPDHLSYFRFVGRIVGKAVSDGYLLDAHFTRSLYKHMLGIKPSHPDMEAIDPDYYKNLKAILDYDLADLGLDLTFSIEDHSFGRNQILDLIENGRNIPVTEENKSRYVSLVCQHRMTTAISSQIKSYLDGFYELVSKDLIQIFTPRELELLISGLPDIDVLDLKKNTDYVGWKATDRQIVWFWNVMFSLSRNQKASFLQFVTGSSKVPLAGFGELPGMRGVQKFSIHKTGGSSGALMSAHTCFNSLDLPVYKSEDELREKLLYAINEGGGAFLMV